MKRLWFPKFQISSLKRITKPRSETSLPCNLTEIREPWMSKVIPKDWLKAIASEGHMLERLKTLRATLSKEAKIWLLMRELTRMIMCPSKPTLRIHLSKWARTTWRLTNLDRTGLQRWTRLKMLKLQNNLSIVHRNEKSWCKKLKLSWTWWGTETAARMWGRSERSSKRCSRRKAFSKTRARWPISTWNAFS